MNKTTQSDTAKRSSATHRRVQHSSTLNRKYVKHPTSPRASSRNLVKASASEAGARAERAIQKAAAQKRREQKASEMNHQNITKRQVTSVKVSPIRVSTKGSTQVTQDTPAQVHPFQRKARQRAAGRQQPAQQLSAKERKDQAIQQALRSVATMEQDSDMINSGTTAAQAIKSTKTKKVRSKHTKTERASGSGKRFLIAFSCAAACVAALGFFIHANMPDISVRVAAMQTGIEATYPSYIPRDYSLANINSEEGKITMDFTSSGGDSFTLTEEKSSWDSNALLNNYVKPTWEDAYTVTHEQGITIYISGSDATWVNGGILYSIDASSNNLTKKQLRNIITSL